MASCGTEMTCDSPNVTCLRGGDLGGAVAVVFVVVMGGGGDDASSSGLGSSAACSGGAAAVEWVVSGVSLGILFSIVVVVVVGKASCTMPTTKGVEDWGGGGC